jgi:dihydrodipicolinate synthase/N-acetylneuraminate lyase
MKDSSGSMVDFLHFMDIGEDLNILTGREEMLLPCLMVGGKGCMTPILERLNKTSRSSCISDS